MEGVLIIFDDDYEFQRNNLFLYILLGREVVSNGNAENSVNWFTLVAFAVVNSLRLNMGCLNSIQYLC